MKRQPIIYSLICLLVLFSTIACSDENADVDTTPPVITINSPQDGGTYQAGSSLRITGNIEEEGELEQVTVTAGNIFFTQTETIEKEELPEKTGNLYQLDQTHTIPQELRGATIKIDILALDNAGLTGTKSLTIKIQ